MPPNSPQSIEQAAQDYERIERALHYLFEHRRERPDLARTAAHLGLSPAHFQKLFTRWAGISPQRFLAVLTQREAREHLRSARSVLDAALAAGLSGPGRLHDLSITVDAASPGEIRSGGRGLLIRFGQAITPFGMCAVATTPRGICSLSFATDRTDGAANLRRELERDWPGAELHEDEDAAVELARVLFPMNVNVNANANVDANVNGIANVNESASTNAAQPVRLHVQGTNFQVQVWRALLQIPPGTVFAYEDVARLAGRPTAVRAVASAVAQNRVAYLIPCHRVIRKLGETGQYRWGPVRKKAMLGYELGPSWRGD